MVRVSLIALMCGLGVVGAGACGERKEFPEGGDSNGGQNSQSKIQTRVDALEGEEGCPAGLVKVSSGVDANADGTLEEDEIDDFNTFCLTSVAGVETALATIKIEDEGQGANCEAGGQRIVVGTDNGAGDAEAGDGKLEGDEISQTEYVCNGVGAGVAAATGPGSLVVVSDEAPGDQCTSGGSRLDTGLDNGDGGGTANDGKLHADEVDSTSYACNGAGGGTGLSTLTRVSNESSGPTCPAGGQKVETGLDDGAGGGTAGDLQLSSGEVDTRSYVCNGAAGKASVNALFELHAESSGANCPTGGQRIDVGLDDGDGGGKKNDGILQSGEVTSSSYVCNGTAGSNGSSLLVLTATEAPGTNCPAGGFQMTVGFDDGSGAGTAGDGQLDDEEQVSARYVCSGSDGSDGVSSLVDFAAIEPGGTCASGGTWVMVGLDNGDGDTTPRDGTLTAGEIDHEFAVCNGAAGHNSLIETSDASALDCPYGGFHVRLGSDDGSGAGTAGDGLLHADEVSSSHNLCNGAPGDAGMAGFAVLMAEATVAPGSNGCATGGKLLSWGLDNGDGDGVAADGTLSSTEIDDSSVVCNGAVGAQGYGVVTDSSASSLSDCPAGGRLLRFGMDDGSNAGIAGDNTLQSGEVDYSYNVCNGETGSMGVAGYAVVIASEDVASGQMGCSAGGKLLSWGLDNGDGAGTAGDGTLHADEVDDQEVICNGATGAQGEAAYATVLSLWDYDPGSSECPAGGLRIDFGGDDGYPGGTAGDGVLDPQESDTYRILCNGEDGSPGTAGATGSAGYNSLVSTSTNVGANCASTGIKLEIGLDNGDGAGAANDNTLHPDEVDQTKYVCDGVDGGGGVGMGTIKDATNTTLGTLIDFGDYGVTGFTSAGYLFAISWQGAYFDSQIYSSQTACGDGGTLWLNAGSDYPYEMYARSLSWNGYNDTLYVPANGNSNGVATAVSIAYNSLWNYGSCSTYSNTTGGWVLTSITRSAAGLPNTITAPLTLE